MFTGVVDRPCRDHSRRAFLSSATVASTYFWLPTPVNGYSPDEMRGLAVFEKGLICLARHLERRPQPLQVAPTFPARGLRIGGA